MALVKPEGQLDELGIGRIRDRLADTIFPGISTIQTRAKYLFIVPYILRDYLYLSAREKAKTTAAKYLFEQERKVKDKLRSLHHGEIGTGIIGITLPHGTASVRPPSEVYWVGLNTFNCVETKGLSISSFLKNIQALNQSLTFAGNDSESGDDADAGIDHFNDISVPASKDWMNTLEIDLTPHEADFLRNAWRAGSNLKLKNSLLPKVFEDNILENAILDSSLFEEFARKALTSKALPEHLSKQILLAHDFAQLMDGAHILYNHIIQEHFFTEEYDGGYLDDWEKWMNNLPSAMLNYSGFHIHHSGTFSEANYFINEWWQLVQAHQQLPSAGVLRMQSLIRTREATVKGRKARLRNSRQSNVDLVIGERIGLQMLQYRFQNVKRIIHDLLNPRDAS